MRITRDYVFDMIEMVGRAIAASKEKPAPVKEWTLEGMLGDDPDEKADEWGVIAECGWRTPRQRALERDARQNRRDMAFGVSASLCKLQKDLQFKRVGVTEALKDLQRICESAKHGLISKAWANQIARIIDTCSRGRR
jgi:hypothetical protein